MEEVKRILVVAKSTKHCQKAVHYGITLARSCGAELYVIHALYNPFGLKGWNLPIVSRPALEEEYRRMLEDAKADIDRMIRQEKAKGLAVKELIVEGEPTKEILTTVEKEKIDLIILLAHEEGHLEHFLFGGSNEDLIRRMPCSILLVKKEPGPVWF